MQAAANPYFGIFGQYTRALDPWVLYDLNQASPVRDYLRYFYTQTINYATQTGVSVLDNPYNASFTWPLCTSTCHTNHLHSIRSAASTADSHWFKNGSVLQCGHQFLLELLNTFYESRPFSSHLECPRTPNLCDYVSYAARKLFAPKPDYGLSAQMCWATGYTMLTCSGIDVQVCLYKIILRQHSMHACSHALLSTSSNCKLSTAFQA